MARKGKKKRKITAWNRKFGAVAKTCFALTGTMKQYGACMRNELKGKKRRGKR